MANINNLEDYTAVSDDSNGHQSDSSINDNEEEADDSSVENRQNNRSEDYELKGKGDILDVYGFEVDLSNETIRELLSNAIKDGDIASGDSKCLTRQQKKINKTHSKNLYMCGEEVLIKTGLYKDRNGTHITEKRLTQGQECWIMIDGRVLSFQKSSFRSTISTVNRKTRILEVVIKEIEESKDQQLTKEERNKRRELRRFAVELEKQINYGNQVIAKEFLDKGYKQCVKCTDFYHRESIVKCCCGRYITCIDCRQEAGDEIQEMDNGNLDVFNNNPEQAVFVCMKCDNMMCRECYHYCDQCDAAYCDSCVDFICDSCKELNQQREIDEAGDEEDEEEVDLNRDDRNYFD